MGLGEMFAKRNGVSPSNDVQDRSFTLVDPEALAVFGMGAPGTPTIGEIRAHNLSGVYRAMSIVANSIAGLPMPTMELEEGRTKKSSSFLDAPGTASASGGVLYTNAEWKQLVTYHMMGHGTAFLQHIFNGAGAVVALNPVAPSRVQVEWDSSRFGGRRFTVSNPDGSRSVFDASTMTAIMGLSIDGLRGISVLSAARMSLAAGLAGDKAAWEQFNNGAMISGLITPEADQELGKDDITAIKENISMNMQGVENAGKIAIMNRRLKVQPWSLSAVDAQFIESRMFAIDEIGRWFGVPPHLLGLTEKSTSWGQGIAEQNRGLSRYTLSGFTIPIQERLSTLLPYGKWVEFDYSAFIKPSPEIEIKLLIDQVNAGLLTLNEARALRNMPPLPKETGADLPRTPAGASSALETAAPPQAEPPTEGA